MMQIIMCLECTRLLVVYNMDKAAYLSVVAVNVDTHSDLRLDCQANDVLRGGQRDIEWSAKVVSSKCAAQASHSS